MNISDEAVEAAAKRYYEASTGKRWENLDHSARARERSWMRRALEAAAPHLMARAWDEGEDAGQSNSGAYKTGQQVQGNPYRSAGAGE